MAGTGDGLEIFFPEMVGLCEEAGGGPADNSSDGGMGGIDAASNGVAEWVNNFEADNFRDGGLLGAGTVDVEEPVMRHEQVATPPSVDRNEGKPLSASWARRIRVGAAPDERKPNPNIPCALESSIRSFVERKGGAVVNPAVGTTFDSIDEAYCFYNLYSWEIGFGVRFAKSRLNAKRKKCMQEIRCACAGKPVRENTRSSRCGCTAMSRLLRSSDNGWYICEHREEHNHPLSTTCGEKLHWQSHRHIDKYTKDLVKHLRENNVSLGKVYSIIGSYFGSMDNIPFTKRSLKTLCGRISRENSDNDAVKTMDVFGKMLEMDSNFKYTVQIDDDSRIKTFE